MAYLTTRSPVGACSLLLLTFALASADSAAQVLSEKKEISSTRIDAFGDPLPEGVLARLGTTRFRATGYISGAAVSPDGKMIALASNRNLIALLDLATGKEIHRLKGKGTNGVGDSVTFSPDGKVVAFLNHRGGVSVWDVEKGEPAKEVKGGQQIGMTGLAFSGDGRVLAAGTQGGRPAFVNIWDAESGECLGSFPPLQDHQVRVAVSPNGKTVASWGQLRERDPAKPDEAGPGETVQLWDITAGKETHQLQIDAPSQIGSVAFSSDGKTIAVLGYPSAVYLFDATTGKLQRRFAGRRGLASLLFSPDGKTLAGIDNEGVCQLWDTATGKRLDLFEGPGDVRYGASLVFTRAGRLLAWTVRTQALCVWDVRTGKVLTPEGGHTSDVTHLGFSGDGNLLVSASADGLFCTWQIVAAKETRRWRMKEDYPGMSGRVDGAALSSDGKYLAAAGITSSGTHLWDVAKGQEICYLAGLGGHEMSMAFSRDGSRFVANTRDQKGQALRIWDVATGQNVLTFRTDPADLTGMAFSPIGKTLAVAGKVYGPRGRDASLCLVDAASGKEARRIERPNELFRSPVFSGDGSRIAVAGQNAILLFDAASGEEIRALPPPDGFGIKAGPVISHDGRMIAAAYANANTKPQSNECKLQLWELVTGSRRREFTIPIGVQALAFSPDGRTLAGACADTSILLLDATGRNGSPAETLKADAADTLWADLKAADALRADLAIWRLASSPKEAMPVLKNHLKAIDKPAVQEKQVAQWIVQLDDDDFDKREKASHELEQVGSQAKDALQKALDSGKLPKEAKGRVEDLLARLAKSAPPSAEMIQELRALEVLEHLATQEAKELLAALAKGDPDAQLTREAKAAHDRLNRLP